VFQAALSNPLLTSINLTNAAITWFGGPRFPLSIGRIKFALAP
jgi:hypothetical protein